METDLTVEKDPSSFFFLSFFFFLRGVDCDDSRQDPEKGREEMNYTRRYCCADARD